ncbi:MAG TPA: DinB family protein [bacterium]
MNAAVKSTAEIFAINNKLYEKAFEHLDEEASRRQFDPETNNAIWLLGHLVTARHQMATLVGLQEEMPWGGLFTKSISEIEPAQYPSLAEIKETWGGISERIMERLLKLRDKDLAAPSPVRFPTEENTIRAGVVFLAQHESYHIGQLSYIRRLLKQEGLFKLPFTMK